MEEKLYCKTLGCKMGHAVKGMMRLLHERFEQKDINLTLEQYFILNILDSREGLIVQDLADIVHRDKSAVSRHIDCLEENHFVARAADPQDKRRKILLVTKPGMKELKKARKLDEHVNEEITGHIAKSKRAELEKMITGIYKHAVNNISC